MSDRFDPLIGKPIFHKHKILDLLGNTIRIDIITEKTTGNNIGISNTIYPVSSSIGFGYGSDEVLTGSMPPVGCTLTVPQYGVRFYDKDGDGKWSYGDPAILDNDDDYVYTSGTDTVLIGDEPPNLSTLSDYGEFDKFYDSNSDGNWEVGDPAIADFDSDGLFLPKKRFDIYPDIISSTTVTTSFKPGRIFYYPYNRRLYFDADVLTSLISIEGDLPATHGSGQHSETYLSYYYIKGANFSSTPKTISTSTVTIGSYSGIIGKYEQPFAGFNYYPVSMTANQTLNVWWECPNNTIRSASFPITVVLNEVKRPFFMMIPNRDIFDQLFWRSKFAANQTIYLKGITGAETVAVSDIYLTGVELS